MPGPRVKKQPGAKHPAIIDQLINDEFFKLNAKGKVGTIAFRINARRFAVIKLMQEEYPIYEIANLLECSQTTVFQDIVIMNKAMMKIRVKDQDERREMMVERLENLANFIWRRLRQIKNPSSGGKLIEELLKVYITISNLLGLQKDKTIHLEHSTNKISKEKRDAVIEAAFQTVNSDMKLLPQVNSNGSNSSKVEPDDRGESQDSEFGFDQ